MIKKNPWLICAAATLLLFCTVGLSTSSFSVYQPYLITVTGLTNAESSMFLTVRTMAGFLCTFIVQQYLEKMGLQKGVALAAVFTALAFVILAGARTFLMACAAAILLGAGYALGGMVAVSMIINRAFNERMGLALSICSAGTGVSMIICPPIATWMIEHFSLKFSALAEAVFILLSIMIVYPALKGIPGAEKTEKQKKHSGFAETFLNNSRLIICLIISFFVGTIGNTGWSHLSVLYKAAAFSSEQVALLISLAGIFLTVGKVAFGWCADVVGRRQTFSAAGLMMVLGLALACLADRGSMGIAGTSMLFLGLALPMGTLSPGLYAKSFAEADKFDTAVSKLQLSYMIGALLFGPFPGIIADASGGTYVPAFIVLTIFGVIATVLIFVVYRGFRLEK